MACEDKDCDPRSCPPPGAARRQGARPRAGAWIVAKGGPSASVRLWPPKADPRSAGSGQRHCALQRLCSTPNLVKVPTLHRVHLMAHEATDDVCQGSLALWISADPKASKQVLCHLVLHLRRRVLHLLLCVCRHFTRRRACGLDLCDLLTFCLLRLLCFVKFGLPRLLIVVALLLHLGRDTMRHQPLAGTSTDASLFAPSPTPSPTDPVPAGPRTAGRPRTRHLARKLGILDGQNTRGSHTAPSPLFFACAWIAPRSSGL